MTPVVKTRIIRIGNSQGIRISKVLLDQSGLSDEVELALMDNHLEIRPARRAREGWDAQFEAMAAHGDDQFLDAEAALSETSWDSQEWEW
jgi:antitoxin MazE